MSGQCYLQHGTRTISGSCANPWLPLKENLPTARKTRCRERIAPFNLIPLYIKPLATLHCSKIFVYGGIFQTKFCSETNKSDTQTGHTKWWRLCGPCQRCSCARPTGQAPSFKPLALESQQGYQLHNAHKWVHPREKHLQAVIAFTFSFIFFNLAIFNWGIMALQYCVDFCHASTWISHR